MSDNNDRLVIKPNLYVNGAFDGFLKKNPYLNVCIRQIAAPSTGYGNS